MRILFLSELFYPHGGGGQLATYLYAQLLSRSGFDVAVVTNRFPLEPEVSKSEGFTVYRLPIFKQGGSFKYSTLMRFNVLFSSSVKKLIKWADIVYVPLRWYSAIPIVKIYRKPVILHLHDYTPICPLAVLYNSAENGVCQEKRVCSLRCLYLFEKRKRKLAPTVTSLLLNLTVWRCLRRSVELSDAIICVSKAQKEKIIKHMPSIQSKTRVIYNPIPHMEATGIEGDDFGYFGGPNYLKGFNVLYKAASYISNKEKKSLKIHATKFSGISKRFKMMLRRIGIITYGKLGITEYNNLRKQIKAVIVPSIWDEPLPFVVTEAIMSGKVLIASYVGGIPEQISGCKGVFLFDANNYKQLAQSILYVESLKKDCLLNLGAKNRECATKKFSNQKVLDNFINVITAVSGHAESSTQRNTFKTL